MSKEELWKIYTDKNPHWLETGADLTPEGVKKLFDQTFDVAHKQGFENGKASAETAKADPLDKFADLMRDIAGKAK